MRGKEPIASHSNDQAWTRPEEYIAALARKRTFRRSRADRQRTQPEAPRMLLSTVPFLALIALLAVLGASIMMVAFPGSQPASKPRADPPKEQGVAQRGWFQEAQKEMHR
jgi:ferric-dicitrate binding protein FerR (iron transport regulator)